MTKEQNQVSSGIPYLSLFSATGGMDLGLDAAGWRCIGQAEWDPWRRSVLRRHWPDIQQWSDVRNVCADGVSDLSEVPELIVGGFPCQDLSHAGKRRGLEGERSGLAFEFIRIVNIVRPKWVLFENVLGLLSSNQGRDLATILGCMASIGNDVDGGGYGCAFRVLNGQHFGVPQRRRRVFILCRRADGHPEAAARGAGQVLSVGSRCGGGSHAPEQEWQTSFSNADGDAREDCEWGAEPTDQDKPEPRIANTLTKGQSHGLGNTDLPATMALNEAVIETAIANTVLKSIGGANNMSITSILRAAEAQASVSAFSPFYGSGACAEGDNIAPTVTKSMGGQGAVFSKPRVFAWGSGNSNPPGKIDIAGTLMKQAATPAVFDEDDTGIGIRRFTPVETERLMGWPDDHTRWNDLGQEAPDGKRYEACGDGVIAPVAQWIGERLIAYENQERG